MSTLSLEVSCYVPNVHNQFVRHIRYLVGYYSGSCFLRRGVYSEKNDAIAKQKEFLEQGFDAHVVEFRSELFLIN